MESSVLSSMLLIIALFSPSIPSISGFQKKSCGVKVVAIEQIKYKAVPVEVVDEGSRYAMVESPTVATTHAPTTKSDDRYRTRTTTKTMDMTDIIDEMVRDHRKTTPAPTRAPSPSSPPIPPAIYVMQMPPAPMMPMMIPTTSTTGSPPTSIYDNIMASKGKGNTFSSMVQVRPSYGRSPSSPVHPALPTMPSTYAQPVPVPGIGMNPYSGQIPMYPMMPMRVTFKGLTTPAPSGMPTPHSGYNSTITMPPSALTSEYGTRPDLIDETDEGISYNAVGASPVPSESEADEGGTKRKRKSTTSAPSSDRPVMGIRIRNPIEQMQEQQIINQLQQQMRNNLVSGMVTVNGMTPTRLITSNERDMSSRTNPEMTFEDFIKGSAAVKRRTTVEFNVPYDNDDMALGSNVSENSTNTTTSDNFVSKYDEIDANNDSYQYYDYEPQAGDERLNTQENEQIVQFDKRENSSKGRKQQIQRRMRRRRDIRSRRNLSYEDVLLVSLVSLTSS